MADPGFPVGGAPTHWGGANLQCVHFSAKTYVKMNEMDPVGGGGGRRRRPPGSANAFVYVGYTMWSDNIRQVSFRENVILAV